MDSILSELGNVLLTVVYLGILLLIFNWIREQI